MFTLLIILVSSTGFIHTQTMSFNSEKQCLYAAKKIHERQISTLQVDAVCINRGLKP